MKTVVGQQWGRWAAAQDGDTKPFVTDGHVDGALLDTFEELANRPDCGGLVLIPEIIKSLVREIRAARQK